MLLILTSNYYSSIEKCREILSIITAGIVDFMTYNDIKLLFKHSYHILHYMTELEMNTSELEEFILDSYVYSRSEYYKDVEVNINDLAEAISGHKQYKELLSNFLNL